MPIIAGADKAKPKGVAAMIVESMTGKEKVGEPEGDGQFLAKQLMAAIEAKDPVRVYNAFKALFKHCELEPHEEFEEEEEYED